MDAEKTLIGSCKIKYYQITLLIMSALMLLAMLLFYIVNPIFNNLIVFFLSFGFFINFLYLYSKLSTLYKHKDVLVFENIYTKRTESVTEIENIKVILKTPCVVKLSFVNGSEYYILYDSFSLLQRIFLNKGKVLKIVKDELYSPDVINDQK